MGRRTIRIHEFTLSQIRRWIQYTAPGRGGAFALRPQNRKWFVRHAAHDFARHVYTYMCYLLQYSPLRSAQIEIRIACRSHLLSLAKERSVEHAMLRCPQSPPSPPRLPAFRCGRRYRCICRGCGFGWSVNSMGLKHEPALQFGGVDCLCGGDSQDAGSTASLITQL